MTTKNILEMTTLTTNGILHLLAPMIHRLLGGDPPPPAPGGVPHVNIDQNTRIAVLKDSEK
eukprot:1567561-Prorocentrum_lima.AAC.1